LDNWSNVELLFALRLHVTPFELDSLEFWRIERILEAYEEYLKRENEETTSQQQQYEKNYKMDMPKMPKLEMPNMNNFGGFKFPKL